MVLAVAKSISHGLELSPTALVLFHKMLVLRQATLPNHTNTFFDFADRLS